MGSSVARALLRFRPFQPQAMGDSQPAAMGMEPQEAQNPLLAATRSRVANPQMYLDDAMAASQPVMGMGQEASNQPQTMQQQGSPSPAMMGLLNQTPDEENLRALQQRGATVHQDGVMERIGDALVAMHEAQKGGDPNDRWTSVGAGVMGLVKPEIGHNIRYENELAKAGQRAKASRAPLDAELARKMEYGQVMGMIPGEGETQAARHQRTQEDLIRDQREQTMWNQTNIDADRDAARAEGVRQHKEEAAKNAVTLAAKLRRPVDPAAVAGTSLASFAGAVPPPEHQNVQTFESEQGLMERDPVTGAWKPAQGPGGALRKPVKPDYERERMNRQDARDARVDERDRQRDEREAEKQYNSVRSGAVKADQALAKAQGAYRAAQGDPKRAGELPYFEEQVRQAQADSDNAWYDAQQAAKTLESEHGWKVGVKDGRYPNAQKPPRTNRAASGGAHPSVGKIMQLSDGRKIKVKRVEGGQVTDYDVIP